jgi:cell wall assembly regulator SMI1
MLVRSGCVPLRVDSGIAGGQGSEKSGMMTVPEGREFLQRWSDEWLATEESFPRQVKKRRWLGFPPATEKQLAQLEKRLGYQLPPSYRNFLLTTNGWSRTSEFIGCIRSTSKVGWLETDDPELVDVWTSNEIGDAMETVPREEHFSYDGPSLAHFDREHFRKSFSKGR